MSNKTKRDSPLVSAVLALQDYLSELERIGQKINAEDLTEDVDLEYIQKLMNRFAECGEGISREVTNLATHLQEAQVRAQAVAHGVSRQAETFNNRKVEHNEKLEQFRLLGEKVRALTAAMSQFAGPQQLTDERRTALAESIPGLENQLTSLIEESQALRNSARSSRMKDMEKKAESLAQSLQAMRAKLRSLGGPGPNS